MATASTFPRFDLRSSANAGDGRRIEVRQTARATMTEQDRYLAEDAQAWQRVCGVLIAIVSAGALSMAIVVALIVLTS